jgi:hypothetical protein
VAFRSGEFRFRIKGQGLPFRRGSPGPASRRGADRDERLRVAAGRSDLPDSDKIAVWTGNCDDDLIARRSSAVDYFDGET